MRDLQKPTVWVMSFLFGFILLSNSGCEPLRKKFIRQKKVEKRIEDNPILTPIDYAPKYTSAKERYENHYSLLRVWYKELHEEMTETRFPSDRRQEFLLQEMINQLQEMRKWVVEEKQEQFVQLIDKLGQVQAKLKDSVLGNRSSLSTQVDRIEKKIHRDLNSKVMESYFIHG